MIRIISLINITVIAAVLALSLYIASPAVAQTSTPWPTRTATPTVSSTGTPPPTPTETPIPLAGQINQSDVGATGMIDPIEWQKVIDAVNAPAFYVTSVPATIAVSLSDPIKIDKTFDVFSLARGTAILFADFEWLMLLFGWFIVMLLLIIIVEAIRILVALWGVVQRILELIQAIPLV